ncbi:MAG: ATP synthase F0 subunit A [Candidatus Viridilinea halotolerans]|uniref:ATP synthase subunit a n=1 Tax=Candidatus Viridilinea halotolerans TaxID=2491704 RepID=A0A426TRY3_9CHLR|nr:MAG: ATP synthase F0 subunit A [Candidatus Viridilinea halotolerans]
MSGRMQALVVVVVMLAVAAASKMFLHSGDPHVEVAAEALFYIAPGFPFTNSLLTMLVVDVVLIGLAFFATRNIQQVPRGLQNIMEMVLEALYNLFRNISPKFIDRAFPLVATIFLYVLISNWSGLVPGATSIGGCVPKEQASAKIAMVQEGANAGSIQYMAAAEYDNPYTSCAPGYALIPFGRPPSTDLNFTFALGIISFLFFQFWGFKTLGIGYLSKFFNLQGIMSFVGIIEFISEIMKPIALALRLFGNVFAGEVLIAIIIFLVPLVVPMPIYGFEIFIGFIQAIVFALLTMAFLSIATTSHDHDDEHHGEAKGHAH